MYCIARSTEEGIAYYSESCTGKGINCWCSENSGLDCWSTTSTGYDCIMCTVKFKTCIEAIRYLDTHILKDARVVKWVT